MEVEVKLRLPDSTAHQLLSDLLAPYHLRTHLQENIFFDGSRSELSSRLAVLRLRFYDGDSRCVVSLKAKARLSGGISRVEEDEEDVDPVIARACVADPKRLVSDLVTVGSSSGSRIMRRVAEEFGGGGEIGFVCLGGFRNVRAVYGWKDGMVLELDETRYDFGTSYEVECETTEPDKAKELLEVFLKENGVRYKYSEASKFAVFRAVASESAFSAEKRVITDRRSRLSDESVEASVCLKDWYDAEDRAAALKLATEQDSSDELTSTTPED